MYFYLASYTDDIEAVLLFLHACLINSVGQLMLASYLLYEKTIGSLDENTNLMIAV